MRNLTAEQQTKLNRANGLINLKALFIKSLKLQGFKESHIAIMIKQNLYTVHFQEYFTTK